MKKILSFSIFYFKKNDKKQVFYVNKTSPTGFEPVTNRIEAECSDSTELRRYIGGVCKVGLHFLLLESPLSSGGFA